MSSRKRKPGRPKLPKGAAKGKIVLVRFTVAEAEQLSKAAKRQQTDAVRMDSQYVAGRAQ